MALFLSAKLTKSHSLTDTDYNGRNEYRKHVCGWYFILLLYNRRNYAAKNIQCFYFISFFKNISFKRLKTVLVCGMRRQSRDLEEQLADW